LENADRSPRKRKESANTRSSSVPRQSTHLKSNVNHPPEAVAASQPSGSCDPM
jgi:hypothetical protein